MKVFKDNKNNKWEIEINMFTVKQVKDLLGVNIVDLNDEQVMSKIKDDMIFIIDVIYVLCKKQIDERKMDECSFAEGLLGDALENAVSAFIEAWTDFFPLATRKRLKASQKLAGNVTKKMWGEVDKILTKHSIA